MKDKVFTGNIPVIIAGLLYTFVAMVTVLSAWLTDFHECDLSLTISIYVALRPWTAILFGVCAILMTVLIFAYIRKLDSEQDKKMNKGKKLIYMLALICIAGCGLFPCNGSWSIIATNLHNIFAYALIFIVLISFILMIVFAKTKEQRIFGIVSLAYAIFFVISFVIVEWRFFIETIFLWENTFIYLLIGEFILEYEESKFLERFSKITPWASLIGIGLCFIAYLMAPRNGHSIDDTNPVYWHWMDICSFGVFIFAILFVISFVIYLLYRPLVSRHKALGIIFRIVAAIVVIPVVLLGSYLAIFVFSGAGY